MNVKASYIKHVLEFNHPVRTSRGELKTHTAYLIRISAEGQQGYGEASPLKGLSIDDREDFEFKINDSCQLINDGLPLEELLKEHLIGFPSVMFGFESAYANLMRTVHPHEIQNPFLNGEGIPINGLVWMDDLESMYSEALKKLDDGFTCLKFKVGAHDFDAECRLLEKIRKIYNPFNLELRVDANGAFSATEAVEKIKELNRFELHSIEQPIKAGQHDLMQELCAKTAVPVALDEELIGLDVNGEGKKMLEFISPQYIIIKPTLIGGMQIADQWVNHARALNIGWWATSALESNIGLHAIAGWCSKYNSTMAQGLGTGLLYKNNIPSPLYIDKGVLFCGPDTLWNLSIIKNLPDE